MCAASERARDSIRGTEQKLNAEDASRRKTDRAYARIYVHLHGRAGGRANSCGVGLAALCALCYLSIEKRADERADVGLEPYTHGERLVAAAMQAA